MERNRPSCKNREDNINDRTPLIPLIHQNDIDSMEKRGNKTNPIEKEREENEKYRAMVLLQKLFMAPSMCTNLLCNLPLRPPNNAQALAAEPISRGIPIVVLAHHISRHTCRGPCAGPRQLSPWLHNSTKAVDEEDRGRGYFSMTPCMSSPTHTDRRYSYSTMP